MLLLKAAELEKNLFPEQNYVRAGKHELVSNQDHLSAQTLTHRVKSDPNAPLHGTSVCKAF